MSGTLMARVARHDGSGDLSVTPAACPLVDKLPPSLSTPRCVDHDLWGAMHQCPYLLGLARQGSVTLPETMDALNLRMVSRGAREVGCYVRCTEARPTVLPGA